MRTEMGCRMGKKGQKKITGKKLNLTVPMLVLKEK